MFEAAGFSAVEIGALGTFGGGFLTYLGLQLKDRKDIRDGLWRQTEALSKDLKELGEVNLKLSDEKHEAEMKAQKLELLLGTKTRHAKYLTDESKYLRAENEKLRKQAKIMAMKYPGSDVFEPEEIDFKSDESTKESSEFKEEKEKENG